MPIALDTRWIATSRRETDARLRLFCLPNGGGGASMYRPWMSIAPKGLEICPIQLPGREGRLAEPPFTSVFPLVEVLAEVLRPQLGSPFALFGHSMGSLICFELVRELRRRCGVEPVHLFVSGFGAPHLPDPDPPIHLLPEDEFLQEVRRFNGTPEEVLQHPELMALLLPVLRADLTLVETYTYTAAAPLSCPISVFGGTNDPEISASELAQWEQHTTGAFRLRMLPGDHFFLHAARAGMLEAIANDVGLLSASWS